MAAESRVSSPPTAESNARVFAILLVGCMLGFLAALPYALSVQRETLRQVSAKVPRLIAVQFLVATLASAAAIGCGLRLQRGLPFRFALLGKARGAASRRTIRSLVTVGGVGGLAAFALIGGFSWILDRALGASPIERVVTSPAAWKGLLASFYGGINEEVLLRLFVMTAITAGLMRLFRLREVSRQDAAVWIALVLAAFVFALGHVPAALSAGLRLDPGVVTRLLVLNLSGGLVFGWLYWKRGFEYAVLAHLVTDLLLHGLVPALR